MNMLLIVLGGLMAACVVLIIAMLDGENRVLRAHVAELERRCGLR